MNNLLPCRYCGCPAEQDRLPMDEIWTSYYIGCTNTLCDAMLSVESPRADPAHRAFVEQQLQAFWNALNA